MFEKFKAKFKQIRDAVMANLTLIFAAVMGALGSLQVTDIAPLLPYPYSIILAPALLAVVKVVEDKWFNDRNLTIGPDAPKE